MDNNKKILTGVLLAIICVLLFGFLDDKLSFLRGGDSANYVLLAKSIATGQGYSDINIPGSPPHTQYPPVLPFLLGTVYYFAGLDFAWMRLLLLPFAVASLYMIKLFFEEEEDFATGISLAFITGTNFYFIFFTRELLAEIPYLFMSLLALYLFKRYSAEVNRPYSIAVPVAVAIAYLTRMIGITIYAAALTFFVIDFYSTEGEKRKIHQKKVFFSLTAILPFVFWLIRGSFFSNGSADYHSIFMQADYYSEDSGFLTVSSLLGRSIENISYYAKAIPWSLLTFLNIKNIVPSMALKFLEFLILALIISGLISELFRKKGIKDFYIIFYFLLLTVWPVYGSGDARRYVIPVLPFMYYYLLKGAGRLAGFFKKGAEKGIGSPESMIVLIFFSALNLVEIREALWPPNALKRLTYAADKLSEKPGKILETTPKAMGANFFRGPAPCYSQYIISAFLLKDRLKPGDVIAARKPEAVSLITGGFSVRFPFTKDKRIMEDFVKDNKIKYIILDACYSETVEYIIPYIKSHPDDLSVIADDKNGTMILLLKK